MYAPVSAKPLWLSVAVTVNCTLLLVGTPACILTSGSISSVICFISYSLSFTPSVSLAYTVSPCTNPVIFSPFPISVHCPPVVFFWYWIVYPVASLLACISTSAVPSPSQFISPIVIAPSGISPFAPISTVTTLSITSSPISIVTFISYVPGSSSPSIVILFSLPTPASVHSLSSFFLYEYVYSPPSTFVVSTITSIPPSAFSSTVIFVILASSSFPTYSIFTSSASSSFGLNVVSNTYPSSVTIS